VHGGWDANGGMPGAGRVRSLSDPLYQSSVFVYEDLDRVDRVMGGRERGYVYTRMANPNAAALEAHVAALEGAEAALACSSGMAAIFCALAAAASGGRIVSASVVYGGTRALMRSTLERLGAEVTFVDANDLEEVRRAVGGAADVLYVETVSNPLMRVTDLSAVASIARDAGARLVVDSTFATPRLVRPLALGASLVVHSATKYLGGHADVLAGVAAGDPDLVEEARGIATEIGTTPDPFACWLVRRGLRTLSLRVERASENAMAIASFLESHPAVSAVHYPGLTSHPDRSLAGELFDGLFGGMLSFELKGGLEAARRLVRGTRLIGFAPSLGDVSTTLSHPALTSHRSLDPESRRRLGITDGLVRLSVGIEDVEDLLADLEQALGRSG